MYTIGLTGGIASGKSTVAEMLKDLGAFIIDADEVAHEIMLPGQPAYQDVVSEFGSRVVSEDGRINREVLGDIIFNDPALRKKLNQITHPRVIDAFNNRMHEVPAGIDVAVWDVPLLIEVGMDKMVNEVWLVWIDEKIQVERLVARNRLTVKEARSRIAAQMSLGEKMKRADRLIDNRGLREETKSIVTKFYNQVLRILNQRLL